MSGGLLLEASAESFFYELVHGAVKNQKLNIRDETEFYVVRLLSRFIFSESLYSKNSEGAFEDQPIALLFKEALEAESLPAQKTLFQNVGDISLYKAGFFQESLNRARIDLDYYIGMGGAAYLNASKFTDDRHFQDLFSELSDKFDRCVRVLFEVSEKTLFSNSKSESDLYRMVDLWSNTGSERAARVLKKSGIKLK
jgi:hypothetical protein